MDLKELLSNDIENIPFSDSITEFEYEYKCLEIIGEGGFGKVRKAVQLANQRNVVIKYVPDKKITSWHFDKKLQIDIPMEIALMCRCNQVSGVIKILKYFKIKVHKGWYIVMERFDNCIDLFDYITNHGHITEKKASHFLDQLVNIMIHCHKAGVCHRDIKDENIVIDLDSMKIYLIDFGAGGILHNDIYTEFDGTRVYSPPEWIKLKQYHSSSLEVWSLGILLYDMVCGNLPFDSDDSIVKCSFTYHRSISFSCQDLIHRCLQYDPTKRIDINDILHHQWFTQHARSNTLDRAKQCSRSSPFSGLSNISSHSPFSNHSPDSNDSGRFSQDTSPFSSPQSSGLEDSHQLSESVTSFPAIQPCSNVLKFLTHQNHSISVTSHRKM